MTNPNGNNAKSKHQTRKQGIISQAASAEHAENARVAAVASKAGSLSDPLSDIRNTDYWACKPKNPVSFIEWLGGDCPVSKNTMVECQLRDGRVFASIASDVSWKHKKRESSVDVVGYRVC